MKRIYVDKRDINTTIEQLRRKQCKANCFVNIAVKPYKGKKYDQKTTAVIVVG